MDDFTMDVVTIADQRPVWMAFVNENAADFDVNDRQQLLIVLFRNYEKAHFSERYGLLGSTEWGRFERQICLHFDRAQTADKSVLDFLDSILTDAFAADVRSTCQKTDEWPVVADREYRERGRSAS